MQNQRSLVEKDSKEETGSNCDAAVLIAWTTSNFWRFRVSFVKCGFCGHVAHRALEGRREMKELEGTQQRGWHRVKAR